MHAENINIMIFLDMNSVRVMEQTQTHVGNNVLTFTFLNHMTSHSLNRKHFKKMIRKPQ